jgi:hypothetical protein
LRKIRIEIVEVKMDQSLGKKNKSLSNKRKFVEIEDVLLLGDKSFKTQIMHGKNAG